MEVRTIKEATRRTPAVLGLFDGCWIIRPGDVVRHRGRDYRIATIDIQLGTRRVFINTVDGHQIISSEEAFTPVCVSGMQRSVHASYGTLNDANWISPAYELGRLTIWYARDDEKRVFFTMSSNLVPETHVRLGSITGHRLTEIDEKELKYVYYLMQEDVWSPNGEAQDFMVKKGFRHTLCTKHISFREGDIIEFQGAYWMYYLASWKILKE